LLANLPKWFLVGLFLIAAAAVLLVLFPGRPQIPEVCFEADRAMQEGDPDLAIENYFSCVQSAELPDRVLAQVFYGLGNAYTAKDNHRQAIEDYSEALRLDPEHGWAYNNRCWSYGLLRRAEEALPDCDRALALLPEQPEILDSRALAYWQLGQRDKARDDLEQARRIDASLPNWQDRFREFETLF
jgi:tetratricopeptide (TPR) repeat protein